MATLEKYNHGQFSWVDLMAPDASAAKEFYGALFGWTHVDVPTDQGGVYTQFKSRDLLVAGLGEMSEEMKAGGMPAFWSSYITVEDADTIVATAEQLGGRVTMPVMQVMTAGRMAFLNDTEGAHFAIWEPGDHAGAGLVNEPVSFAWNELVTRDVEEAIAFYSALFGWEIKASEDAPVEYYGIMNGDRINGGMLPWMPQMGDIPPNWGVYFSVPDCDASVERVEALGGRLLVPPQDIHPGRFAVVADPADIHPGRFAVVADPADAVFSVMYLNAPD
jgi:predicted enzyme related to lactoylglutathione lyase